jgi:hypothetical protein
LPERAADERLASDVTGDGEGFIGAFRRSLFEKKFSAPAGGAPRYMCRSKAVGAHMYMHMHMYMYMLCM